MTRVSTDFALQLERWYRVEIIREGLQGTLIVDVEHRFTVMASREGENLDLEQGKVYLGGAKNTLKERM